jgi:hypothetical protein
MTSPSRRNSATPAEHRPKGGDAAGSRSDGVARCRFVVGVTCEPKE